MASPIRSAWEPTADGRSAVASELEAIFAPLPRIATTEGSALPRPAMRGRGLRSWFALLGIVALIALIGSLAFLTPIVRQGPPHAAAKSVPAPGPVPPGTATPVTSQPATPARPVPEIPPKITPVRSPRAALLPTPHDRCPRFATEAWCLHSTIMAADNELRDAYDAAVRAGVDRDMLVDIRSDWKQLRGSANRDPQVLIRGYTQLTRQLRMEMRRPQR